MPDRTIRIQRTEGALVSVACVALAVAVSFTDIGEHADLSYYATIAQIIPVFLLAFVVDARARLREHLDRALAPIRRLEEEVLQLRDFERSFPVRLHGDERVEALAKTIREMEGRHSEIQSDLLEVVGRVPGLLRGYVIVAVPGEVACLVALADGGGCSFAYGLAALSLAAMTTLWVRSLGAPFTLVAPPNRSTGHDTGRSPSESRGPGA